MNALPRIVILGAGYGGISTAKRLQKELNYNEADITLVDCHDYHYFTTHPHMHGAGTDSIDHTRVAITELIDEFMIDFITSNVERICLFNKKVVLQDGNLFYDYLVIALGVESEFYCIPGLKKYSMTIQNSDSVRLIRQHIEYQFALYKIDETRVDRLNFVVGGAGFSGIQLAAELVDLTPKLCKKYDVEQSLVHVYNIEAASTALPGLDAELADYAMRVLQKKGVDFKIGVAIKECKSDGVCLANEEEIKTATVLWTGGIRGNRLIKEAGFETVRGRVEVDDHLHAVGYESIFVVGDSSLMFDAEDRHYPTTVQVAMQQGVICAQNVVASIRSKDLKNFVLRNKESVASLGKGDAIASAFGKKYKGWRATQLKKLVGIRYLFTIGGIALVLRKGKFM